MFLPLFKSFTIVFPRCEPQGNARQGGACSESPTLLDSECRRRKPLRVWSVEDKGAF